MPTVKFPSLWHCPKLAPGVRDGEGHMAYPHCSTPLVTHRGPGTRKQQRAMQKLAQQAHVGRKTHR